MLHFKLGSALNNYNITYQQYMKYLPLILLSFMAALNAQTLGSDCYTCAFQENDWDFTSKECSGSWAYPTNMEECV